MSTLNVVVTATTPDIQAAIIAGAIAECGDLLLLGRRVLTVGEAQALLRDRVRSGRCGIVLVGPEDETVEPANRFLADSPDYVVMRVSAPMGDVVRAAAQGVGMQNMIAALRALIDGAEVTSRVAHFRHGGNSERVGQHSSPETSRTATPLLNAGLRWIREVLRHAVSQVASDSGDLPGLTVNAATLLRQLDGENDSSTSQRDFLSAANEALNAALVGDSAEPLAALTRKLSLSHLESRLMLLALAPELDPIYQRCLGVLLDDMSRRVGTMGLYARLAGVPAEVRSALGASGNLIRWRVFDSQAGVMAAADEPLRLDPSLVSWILGQGDALVRDPRIRRVNHTSAWPGATLIDLETERFRADTFIDALQGAEDGQWLLFAGDDPAGWRALIELGCTVRQTSPIRIEGARVIYLDVLDIEECGLRAGRAARLTAAPLILDAVSIPTTAEADQALKTLFAAVAATGCRVGVICNDAAQIARLLETTAITSIESQALSPAVRAQTFAIAAKLVGVQLTHDQARSLVNRHPLRVDGYERAMVLARSTQPIDATPEQSLDRFMSACRQVVAESLSHLAERIDPSFSLEQVILPADRQKQLQEIVDNVRFAERVLEGWRFAEQLPYGRGVTALLHGPSGTGKTMAALAVAKRLGVQVLRIDLSRVVSKYIGETEKNIDRVFDDAQAAGAALLFDEAEALLGKRSEVKDAHDRYANIEVAYLLQRMESYDGLAILTTNLWQNVDPAFLRRLRFIVEFPRPDVAARETIWHQCLPAGSHKVDAEGIRLLARKIDLTGGHIRQITLRAAFVAAAAGHVIELDHIVYAANAELAKAGLQPVNLDVPSRRRVA